MRPHTTREFIEHHYYTLSTPATTLDFAPILGSKYPWPLGTCARNMAIINESIAENTIEMRKAFVGLRTNGYANRSPNTPQPKNYWEGGVDVREVRGG